MTGPRFLTPAQVAERTGLARGTLAKLRLRRNAGPPFVKLGAAVRYPEAEFGTDVAVETRDIVLVRSDPRDIPRIIALSRATYSKMMQNLWWAAGYNVVAIPLAAGALASMGIVLSPAIGAVLMSLSTIIVALNTQLLRRARL